MKDSKTQKIILIVILSVVVLMSVLGVIVYNIFSLPDGGFSVTGNIVDNDYNNILSGGYLVRTEDTLYFNYDKSDYKYGVIKIDADGAERIFWDGPEWLGTWDRTYRLRAYNGELLMCHKDILYCYSPETGTVKEFTDWNDFHINADYTLCNGSLVCCSHDSESNRAYILDDNNNVTDIADFVRSVYVVNDDIYYLKYSEDESVQEIRKYNISDKTDVRVCSLDGYLLVYNFIIENDYAVFCGSNDADEYSVYKVDLNTEEKCVELVRKGGIAKDTYDICTYNVYDGKVYVAAYSGLYSYDLESDECLMLYDKGVEECYIVDDQWIYFVKTDASLWRVEQDGKNLQHVYG